MRRSFPARSGLAAIGASLGCIALLVFLIVFDLRLIGAAYDRSRSSTLTAVLIAIAAAVGTLLAVVMVRRRRDALSRSTRRVLGRMAIAWAACFLAAFAWTHQKGRDDEDFASPVAAGVVGYCLLIVLLAAVVAPFGARSYGRTRPHRASDLVEVWHVREADPYFIAYCECGWVSTAYADTEPQAREKAFRAAHQHGSNVAADVAYPLG